MSFYILYMNYLDYVDYVVRFGFLLLLHITYRILTALLKLFFGVLRGDGRLISMKQCSKIKYFTKICQKMAQVPFSEYF